MGYRYNAFISYRHAKDDEKVAEHLHDALERYHIPKAVREKLGFEGSLQIFRDKYDLPVTDSLNDTIGTAIKDSEYLIVICSNHTQESIWVDKEIELFLKTHSRKNIFTVLVNGEPNEVIPDALLYEEVFEETEEGEPIAIKRPLEPLSSDYRQGIKKAKKTELHRLAAGLLGCTYEDLMRRQQQYRFRLFAGLGSAALLVLLAFVVYLYWSGNSIRTNYEKALYNQSEYLAEESIAVKDEDRELAIQLALNALPTKDNEKPYNPHAQYALANATDAYKGYDPNQYEAIRTFKVENSHIVSMASNEKGSLVAGVTDFREIYVWDVKTGRVVFQKTIEGSDYTDIEIVLYENILVVLYDKIEAYDVNSGKTVYEPRRIKSHTGDRLYVRTHDKNLYYVLYVDNDKQIDFTVHCFNMSSFNDSVIFHSPENCFKDSYPDFMEISENDQFMCIANVNDSNKDRNEYYSKAIVFNTRDGSYKTVDYNTGIEDVSFDNNNELVIAIDVNEPKNSPKNKSKYNYQYSTDIGRNGSKQLLCYKADTGVLLWQSEIIRNTLIYDRYLHSVSVIFRELRFAGERQYRKCFVVLCLNHLMIYDTKNGEKIRDIYLDQNQKIQGLLEDSPLKTDRLYCKLANWQIDTIMLDNNSDYYHWQRFHRNSIGNELDLSAHISDSQNILFSRYEDCIKMWSICEGDNNHKKICKFSNGISSFSFGPYNGMVFTKDDYSNYIVNIYDGKLEKSIGSLEIPADDFIGASTDNSFFVMNDERTYYVVKTKNLSIKEIDFTNTVEKLGGGILDYATSFLKNNKICRLMQIKDGDSTKKLVLLEYDLNEEKYNHKTILEWSSDVDLMTSSVSPEGKYAYIFLNDGREMLIDLYSSTYMQIRSKKRQFSFYTDPDPERMFWDSDSNRAAFYDGISLIIIDTLEGKILYEEKTDSIERYAVNKDNLYYLEKHGRIHEIDYLKKEQTRTADWSKYVDVNTSYSLYNENPMQTWCFDENSMVLLLQDKALEIEKDSLQVISMADKAILFNQELGSYYVISTDWSEFDYRVKGAKPKEYVSLYPRYSLEDLIKKGREMTNGVELDHSTKLRYGIE